MDRRVVIPQHIQADMAQHMAQSMPANLRKYTQEGHGYIPQHAQEAIAQHMEKSMPAHMKQYVGAYMQQRMVDPHLTAPSVLRQSSPQFTPPSPVRQQVTVPHLPRQDQFHPSEGQHPGQSTSTIMPESTIYPAAAGQPQPVSPLGQPAAPTPPQPYPAPPNPGQPLGPPQAPMYPGTPAESPVPQAQAYDFITNPETPARQPLKLPGSDSIVKRAGIIAGGLVVLLILFIVIKGLLSGGGNLPLFVSVAQDQHELIHLATNASQQQGITTTDQNFAATAQLSLTSAQSVTVKYLVANGNKISLKVLSLKVSTATDAQLTAAAAATTYDQTFQAIMKAKLTTYVSSLQQTYKQTTGKNGRALLNNDYNQAQLLLTQLNAPGQ